MHRFNWLLLLTVTLLALLIGGLSIASAKLGPTVDTFDTASTLDGTSVNTQIGITFTEAMNFRSVERAFEIRPRVAGDFTWSGNELLYIPRRALSYDKSYRISVASQAQAKDGKQLLHSFKAAFTTQSRHVLYLGTEGSLSGRLVLASLGNKQRIIAAQDGLATGFSLGLSGSLGVYVKKGAPSERPDEIWLLSLSDNSSQRIFRKPDWSISTVRLSPDGRYVAFLATNVRICQKYYGCMREKTVGLLYLMDLRNRRVWRFNSSSELPVANFIDFSPAGQVAYTDLGSALTLASPTGQKVVQIPHRGNSLEFAGFDPQGDKASFVGQAGTAAGAGILVYQGGKYSEVSQGVYDSGAPALSSSGTEIAYSAYRGERGIEPVYGINVYDFNRKTTRKVTGNRQWSDWGAHWSPDDQYISFVRTRPQEAMYMGSGQVWVVRTDGRGARALGGIGRNAQWVS